MSLYQNIQYSRDKRKPNISILYPVPCVVALQPSALFTICSVTVDTVKIREIRIIDVRM